MLITMTATRYETPTTFYLNGNTYDVSDAVAYQFVGAQVARFVTVESRVVQQGTRSRVSYNIIEAPDSANPLAFTEELGSGLVNVGSAYYIRNTPTFEYHAPSGKIRQSRALGHRTVAIAAADSPYTMDGLPEVLLINATAGNVTVTLPAAAYFGSGYGSRVIIRRTDTSTNTVTVQRAGSDTVNGATSITIAKNSGQTLVSNGSTAWVTAGVTLPSISRMSVDEDPGKVGFWPDDTPGMSILRVRDKVLFGDAALYTGRRTPPYGTSPIAQYVATWPEKNSQVIVGSTNGRIGHMAWSNLAGTDSGPSIAAAGICRVAKAGGTSRGFYADATIESGAAAIYGYEFAGTNRASDVTGNSYAFSGTVGVVFGLHLVMESATDYTVGDTDTPATLGTSPGTAAINIGTGSGGGAATRWNMGIRFQSNSLTGTDGYTGTAQALQMAKGHEINWMAGVAIQGAKIRSDVTAIAGQDVSQIFEPNAVSFLGTTSTRMFAGQHVTNGVNNLRFRNAATTFSPIVQAEGDDTNIGIFFHAKGQSSFRFRTNNGANEDFIVGGVYASPVNYLHAYGSSVGAGVAFLEAKGTDTNLDISLTTKGTGVVRFGIWTSNADAAVNGYVTIKDAGGTTRKLATIA